MKLQPTRIRNGLGQKQSIIPTPMREVSGDATREWFFSHEKLQLMTYV
jgi:hypothetical protein